MSILLKQLRLRFEKRASPKRKKSPLSNFQPVEMTPQIATFLSNQWRAYTREGKPFTKGKPGKRPSKKLLRLLLDKYNEQQGRDYYTGEPILLQHGQADSSSFDHLLARSKGGKSTLGNLVLTRKRTNTSKSNMLPREHHKHAMDVAYGSPESGFNIRDFRLPSPNESGQVVFSKGGKRLRFAADPAAEPIQASAGPAAPLTRRMPAGPNLATVEPNPDEEHRNHLLSYAPNQEDGLNFEDALARVRSGNQKAFKQVIKHVNEKLGLKSQLQDAIGDWSDGAENSVLQQIHEPISPKTADYLAAWYGLLANQKSVLSFTPSYRGPDSVYQMEVPQTDLKAVRAQLDKAGIPFRTIVPSTKGTKITVFDKGREMRNQVAQFARGHNAPIRESIGQGRFIGDSSDAPSRASARSAYRKIITAYEAEADKTGQSLPTYKPSVLPHHLRESTEGRESGEAGPSRHVRKREAKSGRVVKLAETLSTRNLRKYVPPPGLEETHIPGLSGDSSQMPTNPAKTRIPAAPQPPVDEKPDVEHDELEETARRQNEADLALDEKHGPQIGQMARKLLETGSKGAWLTLHHLGLGGYANELMARHKSRLKMERGGSPLRLAKQKKQKLADTQRVQLARGGIKAPAKGVVVRGLFYKGGSFIPSANLEKSHYDQYQHVEKQRARYARGDFAEALRAESDRKENV